MKSEEILSRINKVILEENGLPVQMGNLFIQSELDSLGTLITLLNIAGEFDIDNDEMEKKMDSIPALTVNELIDLCKSSITST